MAEDTVIYYYMTVKKQEVHFTSSRLQGGAQSLVCGVHMRTSSSR